MTDDHRRSPPEFLITKEYRRFAEFCEACRRERYIGVCYGAPGVGKTLSARHYARWDDVVADIEVHDSAAPYPVPDITECRALFYTPTPTGTATLLASELRVLRRRFNVVVGRALLEVNDPRVRTHAPFPDWMELMLIDEADRLQFGGLEQLRDIYDRGRFGLVLIGMPGLEKQLARYPQLYSRIGFVHQYRALSVAELQFILAHKWEQLGLTLSPDDFTDAEAIAAIARITGGNFRLVRRLFTQVERILRINALRTVTKEVVEAARETLVIGSS